MLKHLIIDIGIKSSMWTNNSINVHLQSENIVFHGTSESASGQMLRGSVTLDIVSRTKISSIKLIFKGIASTLNSKQDNDVFFQKELEFLRAVDEAKDFLPGLYKYNFEIPLSGELPESMHSSLSHIRYTITTVAKRNGFSKNLKDKKEVNIQRLSVSTSEIEESQPLFKFGELESELAFCLFAPSAIYSPGDDIPIKVGVESFKEDTEVSGIHGTIHEVAKYPTQDGKFKCKRSKIREASINWNTKSCGQMWIQPVTLMANKKSEKTVSDRENHYVSIQHELTIVITLVKQERIRKRIVIRTSLQFVDSNALEAAKSLPCYDDSLVVPPCYNDFDGYPIGFNQ
ncbi:hypothetical protein K7432_001654 [Basidiobolus ranarum]|uniref:Arrestin-like N-terminal domain-containing protein n=1 Tax=Basidiobolus ranarum TaxID=34480 RepID=A0ABR2W9C4_9FUNG